MLIWPHMMKDFLKRYEYLSTLFMLLCPHLMLWAYIDKEMDRAVVMMLLSFFCIMIFYYTHSSTYVNWKRRKGYDIEN